MCKHAVFTIAVATASLWSASALAQATYADVVNGLDAQLIILQKQEQVNAALRRNVDPAFTSLPQVVAVMGMEGELRARLMLSSGVVMTYGEGEQINTAIRVAAITPRQVTVAVKAPGKKKKTDLIPLQFQAGASMNGGVGVGGVPQPGANIPLPAGLLPGAPVIPGMQMPSPLLQGQPAAMTRSSIEAASRSPNAVAPAQSPVPPRRPDQDLIDAGAGK